MAGGVGEEAQVEVAQVRIEGKVEEKATEERTVTQETEKAEKAAEEVAAKLGGAKIKDSATGKEAKVVDEEAVVTTVKEPKTGVLFPVKLADGKALNSMGCRKKKVLALGINIYAFGMYADNGKLGELLKAKFGKAPETPSKELYEVVINSDVAVLVRLVIVFGALTMSLVRKNFDEGLGASIKKLTGGQKRDDLTNKVMGAAKDSIKLSPGSVIEITRLPGYVLQTKVKEELVSTVDNELLCRAYLNMYLGDDPFDKEAKDKFGTSLLSLF